MFDALSARLNDVLDKLTRRGSLSEADVTAAMREVRRALLEADVALPVVKAFVERASTRAVGQEVLKSVSPGQQVIKIVHDEMVALLGGESTDIDLNAPAPVVFMLVGLQGSGKTTTTAKISKRLHEKARRKVLMASLDTRRPAAQEQLKILGEQTDIATLPIVAGQSPADITRRALQAARLSGADVLMLDTAGRTHIDEVLMSEMAEIADLSKPHEILLVADSLTGQDAVNVASAFQARLSLTGIVLTRLDGDGRGGAALSMREVTGLPIKFAGMGEKLDAIEPFHPARIASRILGMGDVVSLVEKAAETIDREKSEVLARKLRKGEFDLDDLSEQLRQMSRLGGLSGLLGLLPGIGKAKNQMAEAGLNDKMLLRQSAIISSMTRQERRNPKLFNASRKRRVAAGAGVEVQDVNKLLKMHRQMADMMKGLGRRGALAGLLGNMSVGSAPAPSSPGITPPPLPGLGGGLPDHFPGGRIGGLPGLGGLPGKLSGLGGPPGFAPKPGKKK
jgi:signal recognition particle subunit SRP54